MKKLKEEEQACEMKRPEIKQSCKEEAHTKAMEQLPAGGGSRYEYKYIKFKQH